MGILRISHRELQHPLPFALAGSDRNEARLAVEVSIGHRLRNRSLRARKRSRHSGTGAGILTDMHG